MEVSASLKKARLQPVSIATASLLSSMAFVERPAWPPDTGQGPPHHSISPRMFSNEPLRLKTYMERSGVLNTIVPVCGYYRLFTAWMSLDTTDQTPMNPPWICVARAEGFQLGVRKVSGAPREAPAVAPIQEPPQTVSYSQADPRAV